MMSLEKPEPTAFPANPNNSTGLPANHSQNHPDTQSVRGLATPTRFVFDGKAGEYFGIWIVNILLTLVTLGLYTPWAKVRRLRYFYGHTHYAGERLDFTGIPSRILVGRLIAWTLWGGSALIAKQTAWGAAVLMTLLIVALPWLLRSTYRFTARNSKFSNTRFYYLGSLGKAYQVYLLGALITVASLGLLFPVAYLWHKRYQFDQLTLGQHRFQLTTTVGEVYAAMGVPLLILLIIGGVLAVVFPPLAVLVLLMLYPFMGWIRARLFRTVWSRVRLGEYAFRCDLGSGSYVGTSMMTQAGIVLSLGLLIPWAAITLQRLKVQSLTLETPPIHALQSLQQSEPSAFAEELMDILDLDISL